MSRRRPAAKVIFSGSFTPDDPLTGQDELIAYIIDNYGNSRAMLFEIALMLREMQDNGVELTHQLVDHVAKSARVQSWRAAISRQQIDAAIAAQKAQRALAPSGYVYFIENGDRIKIGHSVDPGERAKALSLRESNVLAVIAGSTKLEHNLHKRFAEYRLGDTEWFTDHPALREFIDSHAERFTKHHRSRNYRIRRPSTVEQGYATLAEALGLGA